MSKQNLNAPFPYFGGKTGIVDKVWNALGQPKHYIEPFFGSGAVLLARPNKNKKTHIETVNDKDGFICNVWRALQNDPDQVAKHCDWPVNHADLSARKIELLKREDSLLKNLIANPKYFDAEIAGYWIWAASCWIGSGLTFIGQRPHLSDAGMGVHKIGQRPHLGDTGMGVHKIGQRPHLGDTEKGVQEPYNTNLYKWFRELSERLRYVRVVCGDWIRVCGGNWQDKLGTVGIFFDPPYGVDDRDQRIYGENDSITVSHDVRKWSIERGKKKSYRIVITGYIEEHQELLEHGWTMEQWKAIGGYGNSGNGRGKQNRFREAIFYSPHCLNCKETLFENL